MGAATQSPPRGRRVALTTRADVDDTDRQTTGRHPCRRCATTGRFVTGLHNGRPTGPGGECYRCGGKGYHDQEDRRRNAGYERYGRRYE